MRNIWLVLIIINLLSCSMIEYSQWNQFLGNPGRTAYIECDGPDSPEIFWKIELPGYPETLSISNGQVITLYRIDSLPYPETGIALIDLLTGTLLEKSLADVKSVESAFQVGDLIMGITDGGWVYRIDPISGEASWDIKNPDTPYPGPDYHHPIILPDKVIFPTNPVICRSTDDFKLLWDLESSLDALYLQEVNTISIAASQDRVHILLKKENINELLTVKSENGEFLWLKELNLREIVTDGSLLFGYRDTIFALNAETGDTIWTYELESLNSNIMVGSSFICGADDTHIYCIDKFSGNLLWETKREELLFTTKGLPILRTFVMGTRNTIICSDIFNMTCFSSENGEKLWNLHFQDSVDHRWQKPCPAITDGIIIINGEENSNYLLAIASDPHLFTQQGDAFLSQNLPDKAAESYRKAGILYEKIGHHEKAQEMKDKISRLESSPEQAISSTSSYKYAVILVSGILITCVLVYMLVIQKRSQ